MWNHCAAADGAVLYMNSSPLLVSTDSTMYADIAVAVVAVVGECIELLQTASMYYHHHFVHSYSST